MGSEMRCEHKRCRRHVTWSRFCKDHCTAELSALRELRDAVGKYINDNEVPEQSYEDMVAAYKKAKEASDGK